MKKEFQKWHGEKSVIHHAKKRPFFHLREVWFCSLGVNVGFEQDGGGKRYLRPVLDVSEEDFCEIKQRLTALLK